MTYPVFGMRIDHRCLNARMSHRILRSSELGLVSHIFALGSWTILSALIRFIFFRALISCYIADAGW